MVQAAGKNRLESHLKRSNLPETVKRKKLRFSFSFSDLSSYSLNSALLNISVGDLCLFI